MGKLIVFEGTDGSGKATQSKLLFERLQREGVDCRKLQFPRYGEKSAALVELYLGGAFGCTRMMSMPMRRRPSTLSTAMRPINRTGASITRRAGYSLLTAIRRRTLCIRRASCWTMSVRPISTGSLTLSTTCSDSLPHACLLS